MTRARNQTFSYFILLAVAGYFLFIFGCRKEEFNTSPDFRLGFSTDTVMFDTIFTSIGTTTRQLLVHNETNKKVSIQSVRLGRGSSSPFRINIDGKSAFEVNDLEIGANDSAYIFVKVTIDPSNQNNPLIETDSIVFNTNGNIQDVKLVAWGQDAYFHSNVTLNHDTVFGADKPHVIFGTLIVDSLCMLRIDEGAKLFFHSNSGLLIRNGGNLIVSGSLENPVLFQGDRLDAEYKDVPGQWLGIEFEGGSHSNAFNFAEIRNARYGIALDSSYSLTLPSLILYNSIVHNMVNYGLYALHSNLLALDSRITNCGAYAVAIEGGGKCEFRHCTVANFWSFSSKQFPTLLVSNYYYNDAGTKVIAPLESAYFGNCIISGRSNDEIVIDSTYQAAFNLQFDHCLLQTQYSIEQNQGFQNCKINEDPKFLDPWNGSFELDTLSAAKDAGWLPIINGSPKDIRYDLKGKSRISDIGPDLGCYERIESK